MSRLPQLFASSSQAGRFLVLSGCDREFDGSGLCTCASHINCEVQSAQEGWGIYMRRLDVVALCWVVLLALGCGDGSADIGAGGFADVTGGAGSTAGTGGVQTEEIYTCGGFEFEQRALYSVQCSLDLDTLLEPIALDLTAKVYGTSGPEPLRVGEAGMVTTCGQVELPKKIVSLIQNFDPQVTSGFVNLSVRNAAPDKLEHSVPIGSVEANVVISVEQTELIADRAGDVVIEPSRAEIAILVSPLEGIPPLELAIPGDSCEGFVLQEGSAPLRFAAVSTR